VFPLRDNISSRSWPLVTFLLIIANFCVFYQELSLSDPALNRLIGAWGLVPAQFIADLANRPLSPDTYLPLVANLFLHGGWLHIIGNMWYLWIFGDNVEDCLGKTRFLYFYIICGIIANLSQMVVDPGSTVPTIGASGAVSGVLGAYLMLYPRARISVFIFILLPIIQVRAWLFLPLWFLLQLQNGTLSLFMSGANIAWWAHIGGFLGGMVLARLMKH
jgi:membrane associated rhomboid family serine protease